MGFSPSEALQGALSFKFCGGEGKDGGSHFNFFVSDFGCLVGNWGTG